MKTDDNSLPAFTVIAVFNHHRRLAQLISTFHIIMLMERTVKN